MKFKLMGIYFSQESWRLRLGDWGNDGGILADFEITVRRDRVSPGQSAFYESLKPGMVFEMTRLSP